MCESEWQRVGIEPGKRAYRCSMDQHLNVLCLERAGFRQVIEQWDTRRVFVEQITQRFRPINDERFSHDRDR